MGNVLKKFEEWKNSIDKPKAGEFRSYVSFCAGWEAALLERSDNISSDAICIHKKVCEFYTKASLFDKGDFINEG